MAGRLARGSAVPDFQPPAEPDSTSPANCARMLRQLATLLRVLTKHRSMLARIERSKGSSSPCPPLRFPGKKRKEARHSQRSGSPHRCTHRQRDPRTNFPPRRNGRRLHSRRCDRLDKARCRLLSRRFAPPQFIDGSSGTCLIFSTEISIASPMCWATFFHNSASSSKTWWTVAGVVSQAPSLSSFSSCPPPQPE